MAITESEYAKIAGESLQTSVDNLRSADPELTVEAAKLQALNAASFNFSLQKGALGDIKNAMTSSGGLQETLKSGCDSNVSLDQIGAKTKDVFNNVKSLTEGGIASNISSLKSSLESKVNDLKKTVDKNVLGDIPKVELNLQDGFKTAISDINSGNITSAIGNLSFLQKSFPTADIGGLLEKASGLVPAGSLPPNAKDLINGDLAKAKDAISGAIPKLQDHLKGVVGGVGGAIDSVTQKINEATASLTTSTQLIGSAQDKLSGLTSGSTTDLKGIMGSVENALGGASAKIAEIGGSLSITGGTSVSGLLSNAQQLVKGVVPGINLGEQKLPEFNICQAVPNLQKQEGQETPVEEAKPTPAPVIDAVKPELPISLPKLKIPSSIPSPEKRNMTESEYEKIAGESLEKTIKDLRSADPELTEEEAKSQALNNASFNASLQKGIPFKLP